ncbi:MAG: hypothetical protein IPM77_08820 [Crocinitomicaceae bacterium]|nr:hypothetical protein [Crocinitomicaceae bacterium]
MNDLTAFPENYCNLINVEKIYISYNDISSLPDCLIQMTKLKQVMMTDNDFTVFPEILCSIPTITGIGLHGNNIKEIPPSIGKLVNLEALEMDVYRGGIEIISDEFSKLTKLKILNLRTKGFDSIPEYIYSFSLLEEFFYCDDSLIKISPNIGNLGKLHRLILRGRFDSLPESFGNLQSLTYLELTSDSLSYLPESFNRLKYLQKLKLYNCRFPTFPIQLCQLNFLEELEIIGNSDHNLNWKNLPPAIESIFSLKKLVIRNVGLEKIPKQVGSLSKLEELDVSSNNLTSFPVSILSYLTRLEKLIIADNKLPDEIITQIHETAPEGCWIVGTNSQR